MNPYCCVSFSIVLARQQRRICKRSGPRWFSKSVRSGHGTIRSSQLSLTNAAVITTGFARGALTT